MGAEGMVGEATAAAVEVVVERRSGIPDEHAEADVDVAVAGTVTWAAAVAGGRAWAPLY